MAQLEKIVIIEADTAARRQLLEWLGSAGYVVLAPESVAEGLEAARSGGVDLAVVGAGSAATDSSKILAELKGSAATADIRVILVSAGEANERVRGLDQSADDAMARPAEPGELLARVRAQLRAKKALEEAHQRARLAEEGQKIAQTAFQALAVTEKMTQDAFSLGRVLKVGVAAALLAAAAMTVIFLLYSRRAEKETRRAYAAIRQLERGAFSQEQLVARTRKMREEMERFAVGSLDEHRQQMEQQSEELRARVAAADSEQVTALRQQLAETNSQLRRIESESKIAQGIIRSYAPSICLLHIVVVFQQVETGRRLRYGGINPQGEPLQDSEGNPIFELEGRGPEVRADFFGTGFLVAAGGRVLTNRHVVEPWWKNNELRAIAQQGLQPVVAEMNAYFPDVPRAVRMELRKISPEVDLAVIQGNLEGLRRAVLSLDSRREAAISGQPVVLMGYATGLDAILARAGEETVRAIVAGAHGNPREIMAELARRNLIRPVTTQGHLGDVFSDKIIYDAQTTSGGSGGPLFNQQGKVIGVNFAVVKGFGGSNFGIPIRYADSLLR